MKILNFTDKPTGKTLIPKSHELLRVTRLKQHTLAIYENRVPDTILIDHAAHTAPKNWNASVGGVLDAMKGKEASVIIKHQVPESKITDSERCELGHKSTHAPIWATEHGESQALEQIVWTDKGTNSRHEKHQNAHQMRVSNGRDVIDKNKERRAINAWVNLHAWAELGKARNTHE